MSNKDIETITLNNSETNLDNSNKLSIMMKDCNDQDSILMPSSSNNISELAITSSIQLKSRNSNSQNKNAEIVLFLPLRRRRKIDNPALEKLFDEQGLSWNRKKFAKECQVQNICLDDDNIINATKL
ncbi:2604_t:CDS:2, partial [Dentiscutata erythropus]